MLSPRSFFYVCVCVRMCIYAKESRGRKVAKTWISVNSLKISSNRLYYEFDGALSRVRDERTYEEKFLFQRFAQFLHQMISC